MEAMDILNNTLDAERSIQRKYYAVMSMVGRSKEEILAKLKKRHDDVVELFEICKKSNNIHGMMVCTTMMKDISEDIDHCIMMHEESNK